MICFLDKVVYLVRIIKVNGDRSWFMLDVSCPFRVNVARITEPGT